MQTEPRFANLNFNFTLQLERSATSASLSWHCCRMLAAQVFVLRSCVLHTQNAGKKFKLKQDFLEGPYNTSAKAGFMRLKARWPSAHVIRPVAYK